MDLEKPRVFGSSLRVWAWMTWPVKKWTQGCDSPGFGVMSRSYKVFMRVGGCWQAAFSLDGADPAEQVCLHPGWGASSIAPGHAYRTCDDRTGHRSRQGNRARWSGLPRARSLMWLSASACVRPGTCGRVEFRGSQCCVSSLFIFCDDFIRWQGLYPQNKIFPVVQQPLIRVG